MTVRELHGSGTVRLGREGRQGLRRFHVEPWNSAREFADSLLGRVDAVSGLRVEPAEFAAGYELFAADAEIEGLGPSNVDEAGNIRYEGGAKVTVRYRPLPFAVRRKTTGRRPDDPDAAAYLSEEVSIGGEVVPLRTRNAAGEPLWEWSDGTAIEAEDDVRLFRLQPHAEWTIVRHEVPELPRETIFAAIGRVNGGEAAGLAAGTLLFEGAHARREITTEEVAPWQIRYRFAYSPQEHNRLFRGEAGEFEEVRTVTGGHKLYGTYDLRSLIPELGV